MKKQPDSANALVIERGFDAPIAVVWKMWTDPEHFKAWYGPRGATIPVAELDVRVGGRRLVCMEMMTPNGAMKMWFTGEHLVVAEPTKLAYTESMADEHGNVQSPADMGMPAGHPTTTEVRVDLKASDQGTEMVLIHVGIPSDSPGAMGWNMALDKLTDYIANQR